MTTTIKLGQSSMPKENTEELWNENVIPFQRPASDGGFTQTNWLAHLEEGTIFSAHYRKDPMYLVHRFCLLRHDKVTSTLLTIRPGDSMFDVHTFEFSLDWEKVEIYGKRDWSDLPQGLVGTEENQSDD